MKSISGVVITFNEEEKIERALASLTPVCDELVVVDSFSQDDTVAICRGFTDKVYQTEWKGYRRQKQQATDLANCPWVFSLDADEVISEPLQAEILAWKSSVGSDDPAGYRIPRLAFFMGRWIRHTTWYPDLQLRLYRKEAGRWVGERVHERFELDRGEAGRLTSPILHYSYSSTGEYLEQLHRFTELAAADYYERGKRTGYLSLALQPGLVFLKNYLIKAGFLEGVAGFAVSWMAAASTFFKHLRLLEMQRHEKRDRSQ